MPPRRRLVRSRPLIERIRDNLDPSDWLLWLNEELESSEWAEQIQEYATPLGLLANFVFLVARANSGSTPDDSDVFSDFDSRNGSVWLTWLVSQHEPSWFMKVPHVYSTANPGSSATCSSILWRWHR
jgi:hypothetical protein